MRLNDNYHNSSDKNNTVSNDLPLILLYSFCIFLMPTKDTVERCSAVLNLTHVLH